MSLYTVHDYSARETGVNSAGLNASTDMNAIPINGADLVTVYMDVVNTLGAALTITGTLQVRNVGETSWRTMQTRSILAGVETLSNRTFTKTTAAPATTYRYEVSWEDINADEWRLASITAGAAATELVSMKVRVRIPIKNG